ncbi:MAG: hypothetical protein K2K80_06675 [Clostridia bacterium]|nr:hypothetical protein [Clostridia bacterium]
MKNIVLERDDMSDFERTLFIKDLKKVTDEYFESDKSPSLEITREGDGFLVCVLFTARRVKSVKKPL